MLGCEKARARPVKFGECFDDPRDVPVLLLRQCHAMRSSATVDELPVSSTSYNESGKLQLAIEQPTAGASGESVASGNEELPGARRVDDFSTELDLERKPCAVGRHDQSISWRWVCDVRSKWLASWRGRPVQLDHRKVPWIALEQDDAAAREHVR
jgi:hypothetical protein